MLRNLTYYWRMSLAVTLGAAVASAVLTGALLVGDSVRGSLRQLTLERLGEIDHALAGQRFFDARAAQRLADDPGFQARFARVAPAVLLVGNAQHARSRTRATQVALQGVDPAFAALFPADAEALGPLFEERRGVTPPAIVNASLARQLGAEPGDTILVHLQRWSDVPRGSLLGRKDTGSVVRTLRLEVVDIVPDRGVGRFGLAVHQAATLNVFVPLEALQKALGQPGEINGLLVAGDPEAAPPELEKLLRRALTPADLGLRLTERGGHLTLESHEFILKPVLEPSLDRLAEEHGARTLKVLTYLINTIRLGEREVPYSTVAALDPPPPEVDGLGALTLVDGSPAPPLGDGEILLNTWTAEQLSANPGDEVELTYFVVGPREDLRETSSSFTVRGIVEMSGLAADPTLTQEYPGIADSDNMADWDPPFPIELGKVRAVDELYWDAHRGTPKAFVAEATGRRLWRSRWGELTGVRFAPPAAGDPGSLAEALEAGLQASMPLSTHGLVFQPVKRLGLGASGGATDFGGLFVGLSLFLIASAALLAGLLFSLGVEQRAGEIGLRLAIGERPDRVRRSFLAEGGVLAAIGGLLGLAGAVGYAELMMLGLRTWWLPAVGTSRLELHVAPASLIGGWAGSVAAVLLAVGLTLRRVKRLSAPQLLRHVVEPVATRPGRAARWTATVALAIAAVLLAVALATGETTNAALFGTLGPALLIGALALYALRMAGAGRVRRGAALRPGPGALFKMAALNSGRHRRRSLLAATLVASACFLIVTVASYHQGFSGEEGLESGTGGYRLVAESTVPLFQDLNTRNGRFELGLDGASPALEGVTITPFRLLPGEDTSCLNLYQPGQPRVLGVPREQIERGGFSFQQLEGGGEATENPWTLLDAELEPGVIPAFGDYNSATWILKVGLGEDLEMEDEFGERVRLRLVGTFKTSLFQSELLISEERFLEHFPSRSGFSYFLIDAPPERREAVVETLESGLEPYGFDAVTAVEKLESFHAVQNTYLATFQTIGGLGLLLGTAGLAVVLARNVIERRKELATLRAFGFRKALLTRMIVVENGLLLFWGLVIGTVAALLTMAPYVLAEAEHLPWSNLGLTLGGILVFGLLACALAASRALEASLLPVLKAER